MRPTWSNYDIAGCDGCRAEFDGLGLFLADSDSNVGTMTLCAKCVASIARAAIRKPEAKRKPAPQRGSSR